MQLGLRGEGSTMRKMFGLPLFCLVAAVAACSRPAEQNNVSEDLGNAGNVAIAAAEDGNAVNVTANVAAAAPTPAAANEADSAPVAAQSYEASGSEPFWG